MASNRELAEQAKALGYKLGIAVETAGLNNAALVELVEKLQNQDFSKPEPKVASAVQYKLAPHCYLNCSRGVLEPGDRVLASDVTDGVEQLEKMASDRKLLKL